MFRQRERTGVLTATVSASEVAATHTTTTTKSTTTSAKAWSRAGVAILANLKNAALPIVTVEALNSVLCVFWSLECDDTGALGVTVC